MTTEEISTPTREGDDYLNPKKILGKLATSEKVYLIARKALHVIKKYQRAEPPWYSSANSASYLGDNKITKEITMAAKVLNAAGKFEKTLEKIEDVKERDEQGKGKEAEKQAERLEVKIERNGKGKEIEKDADVPQEKETSANISNRDRRHLLYRYVRCAEKFNAFQKHFNAESERDSAIQGAVKKNGNVKDVAEVKKNAEMQEGVLKNEDKGKGRWRNFPHKAQMGKSNSALKQAIIENAKSAEKYLRPDNSVNR